MTSHPFSSLPAEIREHVWRCSVPDDEPEVFPFWPVNLFAEYEGPRSLRHDHALVVDTGFPVAMHVCRESRAAVLSRPHPRLRLRWSPAAGCRVPFRLFRPELDTMYWGAENVVALAFLADEVPALQDVRSLAFEAQWGFRNDNNMTVALSHSLTSLRRLSLVLADATDKTGPGQVESFKQPARRCKLRRIPAAEAEGILVDVQRLATGEPGKVVRLSQAMEMSRRQLQLNAHGTDGTTTPLPIHSHDSCYTKLEIVAATFVEYQPDGSWREACADRSYVGDDQETVQASRYITMAQRPDPEEVRVNDLDAEFKVFRLPPDPRRFWPDSVI